MIYELKGRLLALAIKTHDEYRGWHQAVKAALKELDPSFERYFLNSSVMLGGYVGGIVSDIPLGKEWKPLPNSPCYWVPNRRYASGKRAGQVIDSLPHEPDVILALLKELGFGNRYFKKPGQGYRISSPGYTYASKLQRAFLEWDTGYPEVNDPDMVEVLHSTFKAICEENDALASMQ